MWESSRTGLESSGTGLKSRRTGLESSRTGLESRGTGLESGSTVLEKVVQDWKAMLVLESANPVSFEVLESAILMRIGK